MSTQNSSVHKFNKRLLTIVAFPAAVGLLSLSLLWCVQQQGETQPTPTGCACEVCTCKDCDCMSPGIVAFPEGLVLYRIVDGVAAPAAQFEGAFDVCDIRVWISDDAKTRGFQPAGLGKFVTEYSEPVVYTLSLAP